MVLLLLLAVVLLLLLLALVELVAVRLMNGSRGTCNKLMKVNEVMRKETNCRTTWASAMKSRRER